MKVLALIIAPLLTVLCMSSYACDFHGGMNFGVYGQFHPLAQRQALTPELAEISIVSQNVTVVETNSDEQIKLSYFVPLDYTYAEVTFSGSDNLVIAKTVPYSLMKTRGNLDVSFRTNQPGEHYIIVKIDGKRENRPYSRVKRISVTSS